MKVYFKRTFLFLLAMVISAPLLMPVISYASGVSGGGRGSRQYIIEAVNVGNKQELVYREVDGRSGFYQKLDDLDVTERLKILTNTVKWNDGSVVSSSKDVVTDEYTTTAYTGSTDNYKRIIKTENNTTNNTYSIYNPVTNTYETVNNYEYVTDYDVSVFYTDDYDFYITNDYTSLNYYITPSETDSIKYEQSAESIKAQDMYLELYYDLPDGRNTYDLEADEVWGQYFIYDVINYENVAEDDGTTLALFHFENSLADSSYWANEPLSGSSTYDVGKFDLGVSGTLVLNLSKHDMFDFPYTVEYFYQSSSGVWKHLAIVVNSTSIKDWTLYADGALLSLPSSITSYGLAYDGTNNYFTVKSASGPSYFIDELRVSKGALYTENFSPPTQPFTTNSVLVLPTDYKETDIAVKSSIPVSNFRVGGARPTYPTIGYVFVALDSNDVVESVQIYDGSAWYEVEAYIYLNEAWNNVVSYNLSDLELSENDGVTGGNEDNDTENDGSADNNDGTGDSSSDSSNIWESLGNAIGGFLTAIASIVTPIIESLTSIVSSILSMMDDLTDFTSGFTDFLGGLFSFIPDEVINIISLAISVAIFASVWKLLRK